MTAKAQNKYGDCVALVRQIAQSKKTFTTNDLPVPKRKAQSTLDYLMMKGEIKRLSTPQLGRYAAPTIYGRAA